jgi:hypothetical protein
VDDQPPVIEPITDEPSVPDPLPQSGSITLSLYQCPSVRTPPNPDPGWCPPGSSDQLDLYLWNDELGQSMTLVDAAWNGEEYSWSELPFGTYSLKPGWADDDYYVLIYVPGLESYDDVIAQDVTDDVTFPASPDYNVHSGLPGRYYHVPLLQSSPHMTLEVYVFGPNCWDADCPGSIDPTDSESGESANPTVVEDMDDFVIAEALQYYAGDWTGVFYQSNPDREWQINFSFWGGYEGGIAGSIEYVSLGCGGDLILLSVVLDFGLALEEQITYGEESCLSGGTINLQFSNAGQTFPPSELTFTWSHPNSDATGHGTLQKMGSDQLVTNGTGSLEIHAVICPPGFTGPDYFNVCHSNGEAFEEFFIEGPWYMTLTTQIDQSTGAGVARLEGLNSGTYVVRKSSDDLPAYVFCSPDQGETVLVDQFTQGQPVRVPINGQAVVCDWYSLP